MSIHLLDFDYILPLERKLKSKIWKKNGGLYDEL